MPCHRTPWVSPHNLSALHLPLAVSRTLLPSPDKKKGAGGKAVKGKAPAARKAATKAAKA